VRKKVFRKTNLSLVQQLDWNSDCARHDVCFFGKYRRYFGGVYGGVDAREIRGGSSLLASSMKLFKILSLIFESVALVSMCGYLRSTFS